MINLKKSLININNLGLAAGAAMTVAGVNMEKPFLTFTGMSTGIATFIDKKFQERQQKNQTVIKKFHYLTNEINTLKAQLEDSNNKFLQQQENLQNLHSKHQQTIQQQKQLSFEVGNAQRQLNNQSKKIKKQQHHIQTQESNQNKFVSSLQKVKNKQQEISTNQAKTLGKIEAQVDRVIEIAQNNSPRSISPSQTTLTKEIVAPSPSRKPQTLVYVDNNNFYNCLKEMGIEPDYQAMLVKLTGKTGKTQIKLYDGAFAKLSVSQQYKYSRLKKLGYQVFTFPIVKREGGKYKTVGDDVQLAIDMVEDVKLGDRVILVTGDGDFYPAVKKIKQRQVHVTLVAKRGNLNRYLKDLADNFISLDEIKYDIAKHTKFTA